MSFRIHHHPVLALAFLAVGLLDLRAEAPAPQGQAAPPNFSAPPTEAVSSNRNLIGTKSSPLTDLESALKKPFEIFDRGRSSDELRPAAKDLRYVPPAPVLNNKKLKELLDKRADAMYLAPEDNETALMQDDLLKTDEDALDPSGKRLKTPLDRYYDRMDRMRLAPTNKATSILGLFGEEAGAEEEEEVKPKKSGGLFDNYLPATARTFGSLTNSRSGGGFLSSESTKTRSFGDLFGLGPVETSPTTPRPRDTRLDDFKRLLDGPGYGSRNEFNVTPPSSASTPVSASKPASIPAPVWMATPQPVASGSPGETPGFSGAIGTPMGVPDYAKGTPSLTPTPPIQKTGPRPPPTFNVPRRRF